MYSSRMSLRSEVKQTQCGGVYLRIINWQIIFNYREPGTAKPITKNELFCSTRYRGHEQQEFGMII